MTSTFIQIDDISLFDPNEFDSHYSAATDLFEEFNLDHDEYSELYEQWADYEYDSTEGELVSNTSDKEHGSDERMDEMVETILLKLVRTFDETLEVDTPDSMCEHEGDYIVEIMNSKWNWHLVVQRKVKIVECLLDELKLSTLDSEFSGLTSEYHQESIRREFKYT